MIDQGTNAVPPHAREDVQRTDGQFRRVLGDVILRGEFTDQAQLVRGLEIPLAIVVGAQDAMIRKDHLEGLEYANLWGQKVHVIENAGHAAHVQAPNEFNELLLKFASEVQSEGANISAP